MPLTKESAMKRTVWMLVLTLAVGIALGMIGNQILNAQQQPGKVTTPLQTDLVGMEGKEVVVQRAEFAPRGTSGSHWHPSHEVVYVLEGSGIREVEGQPSMTFKAGDVMYIPAKRVHETKNTSPTDPLKFLVVRCNHEKGQPVTTRVTDPAFLK